ncbi:GNAT family N-acetyltransferase [Natronoglycomyces albus]|uniref:GNAT family N-acetyltransferase n=1 Tax=Natronoglycomyces albus TaxID=2811108 RepID=A0A895XXB9_9ACTN|nr:GNAT family N-acetyltransferase [Natronoglycomyces albus]QSB06860.1 GNAT family N-acetyltransferase [Natronoglycomyces albus]
MSEDVLTQHNSRLRALDDLLGASTELPLATDNDTLLSTDGGEALARVNRVDTDSFLAAFSAAENHQLIARVAGSEAMSDLLDQWVAQLPTRLGPDAEASLTWPSRDVAMAHLFKVHGLAPNVIVAARRSGTPIPLGTDTVTVRPLTEADLTVATQLWMEVVAWDNHFLNHPNRPATEKNIHDMLVADLDDDPWTWVAQQGSDIIGLLSLSKPERSAWVQPMVAIEPVSYLMCLGVSARARSGGVGAALVNRAHSTLEKAGIPVTLLHYNAWNPLSGPFWHRLGYRPLWTSWVRRR